MTFSNWIDGAVGPLVLLLAGITGLVMVAYLIVRGASRVAIMTAATATLAVGVLALPTVLSGGLSIGREIGGGSPQPKASESVASEGAGDGLDLGDVLLWIGLGVVGIAALAAAVYVVNRTRKGIADRQAATEVLDKRIAAAEKIRAAVYAEYNAYLLDDAAVLLHRRLLSDLTVPLTAAFEAAREAMDDAFLTLNRRDPETITAATTAARAARSAWDAADQHARAENLGIGELTPAQLDKRDRAQGLIELIGHQETGAGERAAAIDKLSKILEDLTSAPAAGTAAVITRRLERRHELDAAPQRLAITAAR